MNYVIESRIHPPSDLIAGLYTKDSLGGTVGGGIPIRCSSVEVISSNFPIVAVVAILDYLNMQNRPYSAVDIFNNLHKEYGKVVSCISLHSGKLILLQCNYHNYNLT